MPDVQKITTCLWFNDNAELAMDHYLAIFKNSKIVDVMRNAGEGWPGPKGSVLVAVFEIEGRQFMALNGGPQFSFTEAISIAIECQDQAEIDYYWERLSAGGSQGPCGWLKDQFGVSWQVSPVRLREALEDPDPVKSKRVLDAMMKMSKINLAEIEKAYAGQ
jgi:predicted 3-demethylubiquinone-9 3-methyltransferase (glyoxalase superfamily)